LKSFGFVAAAPHAVRFQGCTWPYVTAARRSVTRGPRRTA